jgi:hypothetical protein
MLKGLKTRRNRRSVSPPLGDSTGLAPLEDNAVGGSTAVGGLDKNINSFLNAEFASAFLRPWLRLERGLRLQKFRSFADEYPGLSAEEKEALNKVLVKANDARALNTKQQITYEDGKILSIRGLRMTRLGDAPATFKIDTTATRAVTKKKSSSATASKEDSAASAEA